MKCMLFTILTVLLICGVMHCSSSDSESSSPALDTATEDLIEQLDAPGEDAAQDLHSDTGFDIGEPVVNLEAYQISLTPEKHPQINSGSQTLFTLTGAHTNAFTPVVELTFGFFSHKKRRSRP